LKRFFKNPLVENLYLIDIQGIVKFGVLEKMSKKHPTSGDKEPLLIVQFTLYKILVFEVEL